MDYKILIFTPRLTKEFHIKASNMKKLDPWLEKYATPDDGPVEWKALAKKRIEKYRKTGLVLRGMRYREGLSQRELAKRSGVGQNELSKIENGKRNVGKIVAKRLANALKINVNLLLEG
jgi:ribosome-binding protein aMBF1 (putative translation factor)